MKKNKKIVFIISSFSGGPGDILKELLLKKQELNIYCISLNNSAREDILESVATYSKQFWQLEKKEKISWKVLFQLKNIFREVNPSVVYSFDFSSSIHARLLISTNVLWYPMIHGLESAFIWWRALIQKQIYKRANSLIVPSEALVKKVSEYKLIEKSKIKRIYNGTSLQTKFKNLTNLENKKNIVVGMVANFYDAVKGHVYAVETIAQLPQNFHLDFVGDGILEKVIKEKICQHGIDDRVTFHGYLKKEQTITLMIDRFDILIVPSLSESFGKVIIEAMSIGLPVIGTTVGGIPEIIVDGETGFLVEPTKSEQMSAKIVALMQNQELYKKISLQSIQKITTDFDIEKMCLQYYGLINEN